MTELAMIVAVSQNDVIGKNNALPWEIPADLLNFKEITLGDGNNAVIMGRRTWESIGRALPKRLNIVVTSGEPIAVEGVVTVGSPDEAIAAAKAANCDKAFIIGGEQLYKEFKFKVAELFVCQVMMAVDYTPEDTIARFDHAVDYVRWRRIEAKEGVTWCNANPGLEYSFERYVRR